MGAIYWQLNDCWPVASWASIDWHGRWKALHWAAKRFYAPVLVSGVEDPRKGEVLVHVTNDDQKPITATVKWTATDASGNRLALGSRRVRARANADTVVARVNVKSQVDKLGTADVLVWLELAVKNRVVSDNLVYFARPKQMPLRGPEIKTAVTGGRDGSFKVRLSARHVALWTWLETGGDARYSDNFVHLRPGRPVTVNVYPARAISRKEFARRLKVHSLTDTFA
jgi:beta-mannosidase